VESVVKGLGDVEERLTALDHVPSGFYAQVAQQGQARQDLG
jgi:hypothetical protein